MSSMDAIWDTMNVAARVAKQIEGMESIVPRSQQQHVNPVTDLQELSTTVNSVRTTLTPFVTTSKKSKHATEQPFEICLAGIKETLTVLFSFFKDLEKEFSVYTWKTQKVKLYQIDFLLRQKLDQFGALFNPEETDKKRGFSGRKSTKREAYGVSVIPDAEARELWSQSFGEGTLMVPWSVFFAALSARAGKDLTGDEEFIKMFINFSRTEHVSVYELMVGVAVAPFFRAV
jgi:CBL proto-oncogene N-terminus, EF hand-like domain